MIRLCQMFEIKVFFISLIDTDAFAISTIGQCPWAMLANNELRRYFLFIFTNDCFHVNTSLNKTAIGRIKPNDMTQKGRVESNVWMFRFC